MHVGCPVPIDQKPESLKRALSKSKMDAGLVENSEVKENRPKVNSNSAYAYPWSKHDSSKCEFRSVNAVCLGAVNPKALRALREAG